MSNESKILPSVSTAGLEALASSMLAPRSQSRLDDLLQRNSEGGLSKEEIDELDSLLEQVDELNLSKARAEYTLRQQPQTGTS
ncbi:hypothetical protein TBK1r_42080 [Stieleria magnilauensis]|uniref:Uncharacterized protein n=1 Tax=Stieleria magnilauensis TaxID=2527963 RepID=A0ABX5XT85_9BACT|nr:hypothetical protein TBK1r_42080 [Planctomycetes bacterium TBK1r]